MQIAKGAGEGTDGASFETVIYEGYGPEGVAVLVEALTDNRNRTASDVRHLFTKHGGNLGATGAVAWQFDRRGIVLVASQGVDEDELVLVAAEAGADDVDRDGSTFQVSAPPESLSAVRSGLEAAGFAVESAELSMVPKTTVAIGDEAVAKQGRPPRRRPRGQRRRSGRVRELRHPRGDPRGGCLLRLGQKGHPIPLEAGCTSAMVARTEIRFGGFRSLPGEESL